MPLLLDWRTASQPDDVVRLVVEALRRGGLVALPTAAGYLVAANAASTDAVERLSAGPADATAVLEMVVNSAADVERWTGPLPRGVVRIVERLWPGPLCLSISLEPTARPPGTLAARWAPDGRLKFRAPLHTAVEGVGLAADFPLLAREARHQLGTEETLAALTEAWGEALAVAVDAGPIAGQPITSLVVDGDGWRVEEAGSVSAEAVAAAAARWIVFVCTGNTCRSPMTEALCKSLLAARLGCQIEELPARGYLILSAGVAAIPGDEASPEAVETLRNLGADLSRHRSRALSPELVAHADDLIAMTRSHLLAVVSRFPIIGGAMRLLGGVEGDLDDPIGGGAEVYAACARSILRHLDRILTELVCR